jgi:hypothetical protein
MRTETSRALELAKQSNSEAGVVATEAMLALVSPHLLGTRGSRPLRSSQSQMQPTPNYIADTREDEYEAQVEPKIQPMGACPVSSAFMAIESVATRCGFAGWTFHVCPSVYSEAALYPAAMAVELEVLGRRSSDHWHRH